MSAELQVSKTKLASYRVIDRAETVLGEGEVRLSVEYFAFTANNITYGAAGDRLGYWQFFPVDNEIGEEWGIIPVWGLACGRSCLWLFSPCGVGGYAARKL